MEPGLSYFFPMSWSSWGGVLPAAQGCWCWDDLGKGQQTFLDLNLGASARVEQHVYQHKALSSQTCEPPFR